MTVTRPIHPWLATLAAGPILLSEHRPDQIERLAHLPIGAPPERAVVLDPEAVGGQGRPRLYDVADGVALVPVMGILVDRLGWIDPWGWITGYDVLRLQLEAALADEDVRAIALMVGSPGGLLAGCEELADWVYAQRAVKPLAAVVVGMAASAAYWLASAAEEIAMPRTGEVGSIGVYQMHLDMSPALESMGLRVTLLHSGARKVDGHPYGPLPGPVRDRLQARLDSVRTLFAGQVARNRGLDLDAVLKTEADIFDGIGDGDSPALRAGLADRVMAPDDALAALIATVQEAAPAAG